MIDIFLFCFSISREECPVLCTNTEIIVVHLILIILDDIVIQNGVKSYLKLHMDYYITLKEVCIIGLTL